MQFPEFEHLHLYERTHGARYDISRSNMLPFHLSEFRKELGDFDLNWTEPTGSPKLRQLIGRIHGIPADHVLATVGGTEGNFLVNAALVEPGDRVVVDSPIYSPLRDVPTGLARDVRAVPRSCRDGWSLDPRRWGEAVGDRAKLLVLCNLNNPTSSMVDTSHLRELADLAAAKHAYLLVDETFRDLAFDAAPPSVATLGDHCIALSTLTKVYGLGGLRLGWIVAHPTLLARFKAVKDYTTVTPSGVSDILGTWALSRRTRFLQRARRILRENRKRLLEFANQVDAIRGPWPTAGAVCFPHSEVPVDRLALRLLQRYDTIIAPGKYFGLADHFRLGLGGDSEELRRGLENLRKTFRDLA